MNYKITILLFIALLSVSTSPIIAKSLIGVPVISISFCRMFIGSFLLWVYSSYNNQGRMKDKSNYYNLIITTKQT